MRQRLNKNARKNQGRFRPSDFRWWYIHKLFGMQRLRFHYRNTWYQMIDNQWRLK